MHPRAPGPAMLRVAGRRLACAPLRAGLARRQKQTIAEIAAERYSADPKFYQFTAGVVSLAVLQRMFFGDSHSHDHHSHDHHSHDHSHDHAPTAHEAPAAAAEEAPPAVVLPHQVAKTATPPQQAKTTPAPGALEPAPLPPAPAVDEKPLPTAVGKPVGVGNVSAFSDGANVWVVEAGLLPGAPGATRVSGQWVRARQMTDFGADEAPPLLEGMSADAGWVLVSRLAGDGASPRQELLAVPAMRGRTPSGRALLAAASPAVNLTPAPRVSVDKVHAPHTCMRMCMCTLHCGPGVVRAACTHASAVPAPCQVTLPGDPAR